jgi:hypothetical protein
MPNHDRLLPVERAIEIFGFNPEELRFAQILSLEGREVIHLADAARIYLKVDSQKEADTVYNIALLREKEAAKSVSLTQGQLRRLRISRLITPPAFTQVSGSEYGRGRRLYLYDPQELVKQIKRLSSTLSLEQWFNRN